MHSASRLHITLTHSRHHYKHADVTITHFSQPHILNSPPRHNHAFRVRRCNSSTVTPTLIYHRCVFLLLRFLFVSFRSRCSFLTLSCVLSLSFSPSFHSGESARVHHHVSTHLSNTASSLATLVHSLSFVCTLAPVLTLVPLSPIHSHTPLRHPLP